MAREPQHLNTIEELVAHVVGLSTWAQGRKWTLHVHKDTKWADEAAGLAYEQEESRLREARSWWDTYTVRHMTRRAIGKQWEDNAQEAEAAYAVTLPEDDPIRRWYSATPEQRQANYEAAQQAIDDHKPPLRVNVTHYSLRTASTYYHSGDALYLSEELGAACEKVWKHGPIYKSSLNLEPKGYMTLQGLLKRLGRGDVGEQVKTAQAVEAARLAKNGRNWARREIVKHLNEIEKLLDEEGAALGLTKAEFMLSEDVTAKLIEEA